MAQTNESQEQVTVNVETLQPVTRTLMTIGALPTSYLISMTYEEQLLWLSKKTDEIISFINDILEQKISEYIEEKFNDIMLDTMYEANGVGLAAPQVGVLKRVVVIDIGDGPVVMINPEILETSGEQTGDEGCLSLPGKAGQVTRPNYVKARAFDENMEEFIIEGEELMARAICHELDHLDGHMYVEKVNGELHDVVYEEDEE